MRILHVMAGNDHGGAETAFVDMCLAMKERAIDIEVATRPNAVRVPMLEKAGIRVHQLPFGGVFDFVTRKKLKAIIRAYRPHIVQTWMARAAQKTPNWRSLQDVPRYLVVPRLGGTYKVSYFKESDYFVAITPDLKKHLADGGIEQDRIAIINNFAEVENAPPVSRAEFTTPDNAPVLLSLARLHPSKALDVVIRALPELPGVYLWLAGEGPERASLEKLARDSGVLDRVRFLGWRTDRSSLLEASDICVFVSRVEPFGSVFVQAWAKHVPVIVSDADGPRQFCVDREDCLMVAKDDVQALVKAVAELLTDYDLRARLIARGDERYRSEFTKERCVQAYMDFFADILAREYINIAP